MYFRYATIVVQAQTCYISGMQIVFQAQNYYNVYFRYATKVFQAQNYYISGMKITVFQVHNNNCTSGM